MHFLKKKTAVLYVQILDQGSKEPRPIENSSLVDDTPDYNYQKAVVQHVKFVFV